MLVQGFIDVVGVALTGTYSNNMFVHVIGGGKVRTVRGIKSGNPIYDQSPIVESYTSISGSDDQGIRGNNKQIILGTSNTPAKSTDTNIENPETIISGTNVCTQNKTVVTGTYTNNTAEPKTFKEIGLTGGWVMATGPSKLLPILYSRSVFPEPVVIPAGESKSFTITIDFNKFADTVVTA